MNPRVTVLFFHPFPKRSLTNRILWEGIQGIPGVETRDMYEIYPEFAIDVEREQEVLERTDVVVFQHPLYWYNCPSLMKEWIDSVFENGWAYGPGGTRLQGKYWMQVITTGGADAAYHRSGYNHFSVWELLRPFEQTALLCGMIPLRPLVTHGTLRISDETRIEQARHYRQLLEGMTQGKLPPPYASTSCPELQL